MATEELTLFENEQHQVRYLNIVKDLQPVQMTVKEIFDASKFNELFAITYVSSPKFFFNTTKQFKIIKLVLGIPDQELLEKFTEKVNEMFNVVSLKPEDKIRFWNQLDEEIQERIRTGQFSIKYSRTGAAVHSKLYLFKGPNHTRVVIGSANFSQAALGNKGQFEELMIFDDSPLFDIYFERFQEIEHNTIDYIPEYIKHNPPEKAILVSDPEVLANVIMESVERSKDLYITEEQWEQLKSQPDRIDHEKDLVLQVVKLVELVTKKDKKSGTLKMAPLEASKKIVGLKTVLTRTSKNSTELDIRTEMYCNSDDRIYCPSENPENPNELVPLGELISDKDAIKEKLTVIHRFIDAYNKFTVTKKPEIQSRIYEIVLYAFASVFMWRMRDHLVLEEGRDSVRANIPPFLVIAGRAKSGKTTALEFISMLLGNHKPYIPFGELPPKALYDYFHSSNVSPILIDELDQKFFNSKSSKLGDSLIKSITNDCKGQHPVLIGTTNATSFSIRPEIARRVYYLGVDNTFRDNDPDSSRYISSLLPKVDSVLFRDFVCRMSDYIRAGKDFYRPEDPLFAIRNIFKQYYDECGLEIPPYFPETRFWDYDNRGQAIWWRLYDQYTDCFDTKEDGTIFVHIDKFGSSNNPYDRTQKINFLPVKCVKEDQGILILHKDIFFEFIGMDDFNGVGSALWREIYDEYRKSFEINRKTQTVHVNVADFTGSENDRAKKINHLPVNCIKQNGKFLILHIEPFYKFIGLPEKIHPTIFEKISGIFKSS